MLTRFMIILVATPLAAAGWPAAASAASATTAAQTVPMHRSPHAPTARVRGWGHHRAPNHVSATFNQRPHTTMAGPRM